MNKKNFRMYENLAFLTQLGLMMAIPIFVGVYMGSYLDTRFNTGSLFLLICIGIGVLSAFLNLYKIAMKRIDKRK
jgi:F0F1-type ATP synthase assembly protein I